MTMGMGGARRMAGVAVATPSSLLPHQHFTLLPLLATPKAHQIYTFNGFDHTIFENDSLPVTTGEILMQSRVVGATPTFQKFNIKRMSAAWIK